MIDFLEKAPLPKIFNRNGKQCYLDPIRKKLIFITPEETVRQKVISYLINDLKVPQNVITVESHLSHYGIESNRRADIIIHAVNDEGLLMPIAIVECKAPGVILGNKAADQLTDYCNKLCCDYAMMVNDLESFTYHYDDNKEQYIQIEGLPVYEKMISGKFEPVIDAGIPKRIPHSEISEFVKNNIDENEPNISDQTEHHLACFAFNILECLLDVSHKLPTKKYDLFTIVEDYGVRMLSYGDAGGGVFNGLYRSFIITANGNTEIVSLGLSTYATFARPDDIKTVLNVAIDNEKESHHSLQLVLDDNAVYTGNHFSLYHHGKIAISNKGSGKVSELKKFVEAKCPHLIVDDKFYLGTLIDDHLFHLDEPDMESLVVNLISYALIRDEYRAFVKNK